MARKEKTYKIKVPVYTSAVLKDLSDSPYVYTSFKEMTEAMKNKIMGARYPYYINSAVKTKTTIIDAAICEDVIIDDRNALLVQISAYNTNLYGSFFQDNKGTSKREITTTNRIGSDNNYLLLFPMIKGINAETMCYFLMFVYEDPSKDNGEVIKLSKILLNKILGIPMQNIKKDTLLAELRESKKIPELNIKFSSVGEGTNNVDVRYKEYFVQAKEIQKKETKFQNVPSEMVEDIINDSQEIEIDNYDTMETQILLGKKEYKIKHMLREAEGEIQDTIERIFNERIEVTKEEMDSKQIYNIDFITDKLTIVLNNFFSL